MSKSFDNVLDIVNIAKKNRLRRRDVFVAIGGHILVDIVGFAAAIYRRSAPYISIPTDSIAVIQCYDIRRRISLDHRTQDGKTYEQMLGLPHLSSASFYDPDLLYLKDSSDGLVTGLAEMVRIAILHNERLFKYLELYSRQMLLDPRGRHHTHALDIAIDSHTNVGYGIASISNPADRFHSFSEPAIAAINSTQCGHYHGMATSVSMGISLTAAMSFVKGVLDGCLIRRILSLLLQIGLPICCEDWNAASLQREMISAVHSSDPGGFVVVPESLTKCVVLDFKDFSIQDFDDALNVLRKHASTISTDDVSCGSPLAPIDIHVSDGMQDASQATYEMSISEIVQYHVADIPDMFSTGNETILRNYCLGDAKLRQKRILIVVDDYPSCPLLAITKYFELHSSSIDDWNIHSIHLESCEKDINGVSQVLDEAVKLHMSSSDLFIVIGGGTLMDTVGFAAALYKGGTQYLKIPTTLVGMIDAGIAAKVGVNFKDHKSLLGRYFAPVACLNDAQTFLNTLSKQEIACGLAEATKMAIVKSSVLFDKIERYQRRNEMNILMSELIASSVFLMLEELQPNLQENQLCRIADFGHEFGHIIESIAAYQIPRGQCVAMGIAISTSIARYKRIIPQTELERVLTLLLDLQLPIHTKGWNDCCDPTVLWSKISQDGIDHKHGMLYLVVPKTIGSATFLNHISDINHDMICLVMKDLENFAEHYNRQPYEGNDALGEHYASKDISTIVITAASGDIGSQLAGYCLDKKIRLICSIRPTTLDKFNARRVYLDNNATLLVGDVLHLDNLRTMICQADVFFNMSGIVTLGAKPEDFAKLIALNGFAQGIVTCLIQDMNRQSKIKVLFPSTQRVHLTLDDESVTKWVDEAATQFSSQAHHLLQSQDVRQALEQFTNDFLINAPLPRGHNVYELSKRLGEHFVALLPRHCLMRISCVYGSSYTRGMVYRACNPKTDSINIEEREIRDFINNDDLLELMLKVAHPHRDEIRVLDACSGTSADVQQVWQEISYMTGKLAPVHFKPKEIEEKMQPDSSLARHVLEREFEPLSTGLRKTIKGYLRRCSGKEGNASSPYLDTQNTLLTSLTSSSSPRLPVYNLPQNSRVLVVDIGASSLRLGVLKPGGHLSEDLIRIPTPGKQLYPQDLLGTLQERLLQTVSKEINSLFARNRQARIDCIGVAFGAVVTNNGTVQDASVLWGEPAQGFNIKHALEQYLPGFPIVVLNDVSAAAWRYQQQGRFCLITVSSGLSNKVFNTELKNIDRLDIDSEGLCGEMGHVVVESRKVDELVQVSIQQARIRLGEYNNSLLHSCTYGNVEEISARTLGLAALSNDEFTLKLLSEADIPCCACGNLADLCAYSSGRAAIQYAKQQAISSDLGVAPGAITDKWLKNAIVSAHPLAIKVLQRST